MTLPPQPIISLGRVTRRFRSGSEQVNALNGVTLEIHPGEFVAVMGPSGSGKTTLMNIIGCLDQPDSGDYACNGRPVHGVDSNDLARLRREVFGFVFQHHNLLPSLTARENTELPAVYAGVPRRARYARAEKLLSQLGLSSRLDHKPGELSGGEQQRVAIARALINGCEVVLADEPTGSLDSTNGREIMEHLKALTERGRTVIVVTHDPGVARLARRTIELLDGRIVADTGASPSEGWAAARASGATGTGLTESQGISAARFFARALSLAEGIRSAFRSLGANRFRTALTLLGIVIGVFSVTAMLGVAEGVQRGIMESFNNLGGATLTIQSAVSAEGTLQPLTVDDAHAIRQHVANLALVAPSIRSGALISGGGKQQHAPILATTSAAMRARRLHPDQGALFADPQRDGYEPVVVLGGVLAADLFGAHPSPVGEYVRIDDALYQVVGVLKPDKSPYSVSGRSAYMPTFTGVVRLMGRDRLDAIDVVVAETAQLPRVERDIRSLLRQRHGASEFQITNQAQVLQAQETATDALQLLFGAIGGISLVVAGIGVMNIMLATVAERTREIGLRVAVGARQRDIVAQFVVEAVVVSGLGGVAGLLLAIGAGALVSSFEVVEVVFTMPILLIGLSCATLTGLFFGFAPARRAAGMDPVAALAAH